MDPIGHSGHFVRNHGTRLRSLRSTRQCHRRSWGCDRARLASQCVRPIRPGRHPWCYRHRSNLLPCERPRRHHQYLLQHQHDGPSGVLPRRAEGHDERDRWFFREHRGVAPRCLDRAYTHYRERRIRRRRYELILTGHRRSGPADFPPAVTVADLGGIAVPQGCTCTQRFACALRRLTSSSQS